MPVETCIRLVALDLDDTLFLERDYIRSGFYAVGEFVRRELGWPGFFREAWSLYEKGTRDRVFDRALEAGGVPPRPRLVRELVERYRSHVPRVELCRDAWRFLFRPPAGIVMGVVTDGRPISQRAKVSALGLDRLGVPVQYTGLWGPRYAKPHPRAFLGLARRFRVEGPACLFVGDNPARDFAGPLALGWTVRRIRRPGGLFASTPSPGVPEIGSFDEIAALLGDRRPAAPVAVAV